MALRSHLQVLKPICTVLAAGCFLVLCPIVILAQVFSGVAIFEMGVSFLPQVLLMSLIAGTGLALFRPRLAVVAGIVFLIAAWPFFSFSKYQAPSGGDCPSAACLTVITANVFLDADAMAKLGAISTREDADVVAINETSPQFGPAGFDRHFPNHQRLLIDRGASGEFRARMTLTVLTKTPVQTAHRVPPTSATLRELVHLDLADAWAGTRIISAHTMIPTTSPGLAARNNLIDLATRTATETDSFILMGDFNMTPWSPTFHQLPGRRAGDPRLTYTWPSFFPLLGIPIDHIMASDDLELVEFRILEPIGSDHYPILARYRRRG